jgi:hypothetical protein
MLKTIKYTGDDQSRERFYPFGLTHSVQKHEQAIILGVLWLGRKIKP